MAENRTSERPAAPVGEAGTPRRDPFSHGSLPLRPNYLPEEEEGGSKRSEFWNMVKAILVASAVIIALGLLLRR